MKVYQPAMLTTGDHSRDSAGMRYVYPVISRRAGGISIGINLNTNNACNWRCVYCQVPDLSRGGPPPIDLAVLEHEVRSFLCRAASADFLASIAPEGARQIVDVAFSGNGEPTSAPELSEAVALVQRALTDAQMPGTLLRLITNGSLVDRPGVQEALRRIGRHGEVWFKVDTVSPDGMARINGVRLNAGSLLRRLRLCGGLAPTRVQTCLFSWDGQPPAAADMTDYLDFLAQARDAITGVLLYGLARSSCQPEAGRLGRLSEQWLNDVARRIEAVGLTVTVSP